MCRSTWQQYGYELKGLCKKLYDKRNESFYQIRNWADMDEDVHHGLQGSIYGYYAAWRLVCRYSPDTMSMPVDHPNGEIVVSNASASAIRKAFHFPAFYGQNWHAFWDLLWSERDASRIVVRGLQTLLKDFQWHIDMLEILQCMRDDRAKYGEVVGIEIVD